MKNKDKKVNIKAISNILLVVSFLFVIYSLSTLTVIMPDKEFSDNENTTLTTLEDVFSGNVFEKLVSGELTAKIADYYKDQFPFRDASLKLRSFADIMTARLETSSVMYGSGGYLIERHDFVGHGSLNINLSSVNKFTEAAEKAGVPVFFAVAPNKSEVLDSYFPVSYNGGDREDIHYEILTSSDATLLYPELRRMASEGKYVYYKTDHHWTTFGAYSAYKILAEEMGIAPMPSGMFSVKTPSDKFLGTTYSAAMPFYSTYDTIEYYRYEGDEEFVTDIIDMGVSFNGFYDTSYLDVKDKYSSFIGGNNARVTVTKMGEERERLLVIKDSFFHSMVPFFAYHYDLDIIDLRYYKDSVYSLMQETDADKVLILVGTDSLTDTPVLRTLTYKLPQ